MPTKTRARERAARPSSLVVLLAMEVAGAVRRHQNLRIGLAEHKFWLYLTRMYSSKHSKGSEMPECLAALPT